MHPLTVILVLSLLALGGCQQSRDNSKLIEKHRPALNAKLERIQGLREKLAAIPPAREGSINMGQAPLVMVGYDHAKVPTGTVVYEQSLADLRTENMAALHYVRPITHAQLLTECGSLKPDAYTAEHTETLLQACESIAYVFVLRTQARDERTFVGDVVALEVETGRHLGGFPVTVKSEGRTDEVTTESRTSTRTTGGRRRRERITKTTGTKLVNADREQLRSDMEDEIQAQIKELVPAVQWLN